MWRRFDFDHPDLGPLILIAVIAALLVWAAVTVT